MERKESQSPERGSIAKIETIMLGALEEACARVGMKEVHDDVIKFRDLEKDISPGAELSLSHEAEEIRKKYNLDNRFSYIWGISKSIQAV